MQVRGDAAVREWKHLQDFMKPYAAAASAVPPAAIRADLGAAATALARYTPSLLAHGGRAAQLVQPFGTLVEGVVRDPFIKNWLDLLCFLLSGLPASGTIAAEVRHTLSDLRPYALPSLCIMHNCCIRACAPQAAPSPVLHLPCCAVPTLAVPSAPAAAALVTTDRCRGLPLCKACKPHIRAH